MLGLALFSVRLLLTPEVAANGRPTHGFIKQREVALTKGGVGGVVELVISSVLVPDPGQKGRSEPNPFP